MHAVPSRPGAPRRTDPVPQRRAPRLHAPLDRYADLEAYLALPDTGPRPAIGHASTPSSAAGSSRRAVIAPRLVTDPES